MYPNDNPSGGRDQRPIASEDIPRYPLPFPIHPRDAWLLAGLLRSKDAPTLGVSRAGRQIVGAFAVLRLDQRRVVWETILAEHPDREAIIRAIEAQDPSGPALDFGVIKNEWLPNPTAQWLLKQGHWPVAIHQGEKRPIGEDWGAVRPTEESLVQAFSGNINHTLPGIDRFPGVGIKLGPDAGVIDIETDGPKGEESFVKLMGGEIPATIGWTSARGPHRLFLYDPRFERYAKSIIKLASLPDLEIRVGGHGKQLQSNCPPTKGDDKKPRLWNEYDSAVALPEVAFSFLDKALSKPAVRRKGSSAVGANGKAKGGSKALRGDALSAYVSAAVERECHDVETTAEGERNKRLNVGSFNLGQLVGARVLMRSEAETPLLESARRSGLPDAESIRTIKSGLDKGILKPRDLSGIGTRHTGKAMPPPSANGDGCHESAEEQPVHLTDLGNAKRLVTAHGEDFHHCHPWGKSIVWRGQRWAIDDVGTVQRYARDTVLVMYRKASEVGVEARRDLVKWALKSEARDRLSAMISLAQSEEGIPVTPDQLDSNPWSLNTRNGTLDLRTGKLHQHHRDDLITCLAPVAFDLKAKCPLWDKALLRIFNKNADLIAFWDRLCGMFLTGDTSEQILPILWGAGANGKTTLLGALLEILGTDYAITAPPGLLLMRRGESHPTERAVLFGKRLVVDMESAEGARLNEAWVKQLTGSDRITARRMREDFWDFAPTHKIVMGTNHRPEIKETKNAIWRRVKLVPFDIAIPEEEQIKDLPQQLRKEYPGILARCVRGCLDWQKNGLGIPKAVVDATTEYRAEQDLLAGFLVDECIENASVRTRAMPLYERYRARMQRLGGESMSLTAFGMAMKERGFVKKESGGMWYLGVGLRQDQAAPADQPT